MYADDTILFCNMDSNVDKHVINNELCKISVWLGVNKLSLNISKTRFMVFYTSNRSFTYPVLQMDRRPIENVAQFNFLGLILQSNLAWSKHVNNVSLKTSKMIGILYRLKALYQSAVLQILYNTLIFHFFFNYCILVWGATISDRSLLHRLQKKALRLISGSNYIAHTEPVCKNLYLLKLTDMFPVVVWKFYYKLMNDQLLIYFVYWKPVLPRVCTLYEIRSPAFHLP